MYYHAHTHTLVCNSFEINMHQVQNLYEALLTVSLKAIS